MLRNYLVMYDVCDDKRVKAAFKTMCGFGEHLQFSVFRCDLSPMALVKMKSAMSELIDHREDQVLIFDLGPTDSAQMDLVESLGVAYSSTGRTAVIV